MRFIRTVAPLALVVAATAAAPAAAGVPAGSAAVRQFEGTVVSVSPGDRSFRLRDSERGTVRIRVTGSTRFERIAGFSALRAGMTNIESTVRRSGGRWVATQVERSGGGGQHGGSNGGDDNGGDRHGGRGSDDD